MRGLADLMPTRPPVPPGTVHTVLKQRRMTEGAPVSPPRGRSVAVISPSGAGNRALLMTIARRRLVASRPDAAPTSPGAPPPRPTTSAPWRTRRRRWPGSTHGPNELLSGGPEAFERTLRGLRGHPVVVNKWASWCGPCRFEFPFFQKQVEEARQADRLPGGRLRGRARRGARVPGGVPGPLSELLRPRRATSPSCLGSERNFPTTTFYDRRRRARLHEAGRLRLGGGAGGRHPRVRHRAARGRDNEHVMRWHALRSRLRVGPRRAGRCCRPQRGAQQDGGPLVRSVELDMTINPASAGWVEQALDDAESDGADLVIFRLDTPGGLDDSTRDIVKDILAAPMPVVVYVSPNGARAASAGAVHHRGRGRGGDGARDEHRLGDADLARRRRAGRGAGPQDPQRRGRLRARAGGGARPQRRPRGADGARRRERDRHRGRAAQPRRHRRRRRAGRWCASSTASGCKGPKAQTLETTGARIDSRRTCRSSSRPSSCS